MGMGSGIVLFVIGAILAFAINVDVGWADLNLIGYILMIAGAVVFVISLIIVLTRRGRTVHEVDDGTRVVRDDDPLL